MKTSLAKVKSKVKEKFDDNRDLIAAFAPLVISNVVLVALAVYAKRKFDVNTAVLFVDPELIRQVEEDRATLLYWLDENEDEHFKTINEDGTPYSPEEDA